MSPPRGSRLRRLARRGGASRIALPIAIALLVALAAPTAADAAFTRAFLGYVSGTPSARFPVPLEAQSGGIATDSEDDLWFAHGRYPSASLDRFGPAYGSPPSQFLSEAGVEAFTVPYSMAIERSSGHIYTTGFEAFREIGEYDLAHHVEVFDEAGQLLSRWPQFEENTYVAVDNSTETLRDPSSCSVSGCVVYVSHAAQAPAPPTGDGLPGGVEKLNSNGEAVDFTDREGKPIALPYVKNNEIVGSPQGGCEPEPGGRPFSTEPAVTVDSEGDVYVLDGHCRSGKDASAILEYLPSGEFKRAIFGSETPGLAGDHGHGGFGPTPPKGIAFDPVSNHLLVSLSGLSPDVGAVDEFDAATGRFVDQVIETSPGADLASANQLATDSHGDLYAVDPLQGAIAVYGPGRFFPSVTLAEATERRPQSAVLGGSVDPEGLALADCHFEYLPEAAYRHNVQEHGGLESEGFADLSSGGEAPCEPAAASIPADASYHQVHAAIAGLAGGVTYRYRLVATTQGALGGRGASASLAFTAPAVPRIDASAVSDVSSSSVALHAQIDPRGAATGYYFQYVDQAHYEPAAADPYQAGTRAPIVPAGLGAGGPTGSEEASTLQRVAGLAADTTYHVRVVASNEIGEADGPDVSFTTLSEPTAGLPDGRSYELVTPANKGGASDMFAVVPLGPDIKSNDVGFSSDSGDQFLLETNAAFGAFAASFTNGYVFSRSPSGWSFEPLASPTLGVQGISEIIADPRDLARVAFDDNLESAASEVGTRRATLVGAPGEHYSMMTLDAPLQGLEQELVHTRVVGASRDMGHVLLDIGDHALCPGAEAQDPGSTALCEWADGELMLVNANGEGGLLSKCGALLGQDDKLTGGAHGAISADGSKVFFTAPDPHMRTGAAECWNGGGSHTPQLYMRSNGATAEISAPEAGVKDPTGSHPTAYVGASEDGSKVFFVTTTELTKDALGLHDLELYEYDTESGELTRVSSGESGALAGNVYAVQAISADGTAVYFTAFGALARGATQLTASLGENIEPVNLYRYDTVSKTITFISLVNTREQPSADSERWWPGFPVAPHPEASWYTTPDGRYLVFATSRELTGYGDGGPCSFFRSQAMPNGHCQELYRYSYGSPSGASIVCVSCDPSGAAPVSNALFTRSASHAIDASPVRAMSDDGAYVFFDTADALVPQDSNGTLDVYEWHDGRVSLISSGKDPAPSFFLGASADGSNVFFGTHARLVPQDTDTAGDVYDARICTTADPCIKPPAGATAQCEGDACQSPQALPLVQSPATIAGASSGNVAVTGASTHKRGKAKHAKKRRPARKSAHRKRRAHVRKGRRR